MRAKIGSFQATLGSLQMKRVIPKRISNFQTHNHRSSYVQQQFSPPISAHTSQTSRSYQPVPPAVPQNSISGHQISKIHASLRTLCAFHHTVIAKNASPTISWSAWIIHDCAYPGLSLCPVQLHMTQPVERAWARWR